MTQSSSPKCSRCGTSLSAETTDGLCPKCLLSMNLDSRTMPEEEKPPAVPAPSPEELAAKLPQFEILELLGRGGMGIVYKARQKALDRIVAIKILAGEWQQDPGFSERFEKEAKLLARLNHPNIVTVHDFGDSEGLYYIVMEYVDGINLRDLLRDGHLEPKQALSIIPPVCEALQFAHEKGIVHRDIKPENLLLDREGRIKIADFGIAGMVGAAGEASGTPPYMAPEQGGADVDHRVDIYALGVVLYETLTGERPEGKLEAPSQKVQIDIRIDDIVLRALNTEPERRYGTADQFRTMVETVVTTTPGSPPPAPPAPSNPDATEPPSSSPAPFNPLWKKSAGISLIVIGAISALTSVLSLIILPMTGIAFSSISKNAWLSTPLASELNQGQPGGAGLSIIGLLLIAGTLLFSLAASVLSILGGRQILRDSTRPMALVGGIACCFTPFWWPLGVVLGIFAIVVITLDKQRTPGSITDQDDRATAFSAAVPAGKGGPSLSGFALTGAILQGLALGAVVLFILLANIISARPPHLSNAGPSLNWAGAIITLLVVLLPIALIVPGSIFGLLGAKHIRNSEGKLYGMRLAKFAVFTPIAIFFLLLLITAIHLTGETISSHGPRADHVTFILITILIVLTTLALFVAVLRRASHALSGTRPEGPLRFGKTTVISLVLFWLAAGFLVFLQRPRDVDEPTSTESPDQQYTAMVVTEHNMRMFGSDHLNYRINLQDNTTGTSRRWIIKAPLDRLRTGPDAAPLPTFFFADHGLIDWSPDSLEAAFLVKGVPVFQISRTRRGRFNEKPMRGTAHKTTPRAPAEAGIEQ